MPLPICSAPSWATQTGLVLPSAAPGQTKRGKKVHEQGDAWGGLGSTGPEGSAPV